MKAILLLPVLFSLFLGALGLDDVYPHDPYLAYRPNFARSLPVQVMITGVILTLVTVLFIHLLFTAQYHWPLAPVNYVLQLSGVTTLLISLIATIHVVLSSSLAESEKWPYMLNYISVNVPPLDWENNDEEWSTAERATWLVMNASTSGLIQITHIQFLTLLYPSRLEGRLIFALLGPLAILAAIMQLLPISNNANVINLSTDVRNVCNATLSLLFTLALFIWGLLVNRKQAWRTDGGTAVFGCAALSLAVVSTALNFLYVHKDDELVWLPSLMWAVVLWQSFLGWWWWVGAGSGKMLSREYDTVEEKLQREARKERRKTETRERRRENKIRAQRMWKGVAGAFRPGQDQPRHRRGIATDSEEVIVDDTASQLSHASSVTVTGSVTGATTTQTYTSLPRILPRVVHRYYAFMRREHNAAARVQAVERVERMRSMGRRESSPRAYRDAAGPSSVVGWGWGWHGFGWRRRSDDENLRARVPEKSQSRGRSPSTKEESHGSEFGAQVPPGRDHESDEDPDDMYVSEERSKAEGGGAQTQTHAETQMETRTEGGQDVHEQPQRPRTTPLPAPGILDDRPSSIWWWGPLKRWRLQDSTTY